VVAVTFLSLFISVGFSFYSYGALFKSLAGEFGSSRLGIGLGSSLLFGMTGVLAPFIGHQVDHRSIRKMMAIGAVTTALGFLLVSRIDALWQFYAAFALVVAVGLALMGQLPATALVANWFVRRRGMALGISTMGVSLSGMIMAPAATVLIEVFGWRGTFQVFGILTLVLVTPAVWLVVVDRPEDMGLLPDGRRRAPSEETIRRQPLLPLSSGEPMLELPTDEPADPVLKRRIHRDPNFWVISISIAFNFCGNGAILTHMIPHATDLGFSAQRAALVLSLAAGMGAAGKLVFGWIADHTDLRWALWLATGLQTAAVIILILLPQKPTYASLLFALALFGLGMGGIVPLWGSLVGRAFGRRVFGRAMGLMSPVMLPLQLWGVPFAGWCYDRFGTYELAFKTFVWLYVAAMASLLFLRLPRGEASQRLEE
jgi:MFS family permease